MTLLNQYLKISLFLLLSNSAVGQQEVYIVQRGDTLGKISQDQFQNAGLWAQLAKYNKISNPNLIKTKQRIVIPSQAQLVLNTEQSDYDAIRSFGQVMSNFSITVLDGKQGLIDQNGTIVLEPDYDAIGSVLPAQDVQQFTPKKVTIGIDLLPLIGGFANAQFGFLHNNGKNEVSIGGFTGQNPDEDLGFVGIWPSYRLYPIGEGILKDIFLEGGFGVGFINWDYSKEEVSAITFWPTVNLGYRLSWNFGLSVAPYVGGNYAIGKVEASDGTVKTFEDGSELTGSFGPSFGLELGYMF